MYKLKYVSFLHLRLPQNRNKRIVSRFVQLSPNVWVNSVTELKQNGSIYPKCLLRLSKIEKELVLNYTYVIQRH